MSSEPDRPIGFLPDFHDADGAYTRAVGWLQRGLHSAKHPFHLLTLATVDEAGWPQLRTCVLRGIDAASRVIHVHTDARSPKVRHLTAGPRACLLFYDASARFQVKVPAAVTLHRGDEFARAAWVASRDASRGTYATPHPPSRIIPADADTAYPPAAGVEDPAFENFVLLACHFDVLELLELHAAGHRRARLTWRDGWTMERLAP